MKYWPYCCCRLNLLAANLEAVTKHAPRTYRARCEGAPASSNSLPFEIKSKLWISLWTIYDCFSSLGHSMISTRLPFSNICMNEIHFIDLSLILYKLPLLNHRWTRPLSQSSHPPLLSLSLPSQIFSLFPHNSAANLPTQFHRHFVVSTQFLHAEILIYAMQCISKGKVIQCAQIHWIQSDQ